MILACDCGQDHEVGGPVADLIAELGLCVRVTVPVEVPPIPPGSILGIMAVRTDELAVPARTWRVPRVWIAMHGLKARELPELAERHGWDEVT